MKDLISYLKEDLDNWMNDPLYHGGIWEDIAVIGITIILLSAFFAGVVLWTN